MTTDQTRRDLLKAAGATALALGPGLTLIAPPTAARPVGSPASPANRWGLLIDTRRCEPGCTACVDACKAEMGLSGHDRPLTDAQYIRKVDVRDPATGHAHSLPVMCQHCAKPPCVDVCPTGASMKRALSLIHISQGIVR